MANTYKALSTTTVGAGGAASISFTNIPQTYTDLIIKISSRAANATNNYTLTVNGGNGTSRVLYGGSGSLGSFTSNRIDGLTITSGFTANYFSNGEWYIPSYASNVNPKSLSADEVQEQNNAGAGSVYMYMNSALNVTLNPITSLTLTANSGYSFAQYTTATLYGVFNADVSSAPATPTIGTATAGTNNDASITFTGVSNAASYTMTSTPSSITGTGTTSPITVSGLSTGTAYTFKVKSNNPFGSSAESAASNSITAASTVYESIATVTLGGSTASATFSSIPATYKHLQIRCLSSGQDNTNVFVRFNGDSGTSYSQHRLTADGSTMAAGGASNQNNLIILDQQAGGSTWWNATIVDILDYANTNKYKTVRSFNGIDKNGSGFLYLMSGLWFSTSAINSIVIRPVSNNLNANSKFALYGIKGA